MADDAPETNVVAPPKVFPVTAVSSLEDFQARISVNEKVSAVLFWSKSGGALSGQALSNFELVSDDPEFSNTISFIHVDAAESREIAQQCKVYALPAVQFYFGSNLIEEFSGNNAEKVKLMAKNAVVRRVELIKEAEAQAAAAAAEAAAAAAAVEEGDAPAE